MASYSRHIVIVILLACAAQTNTRVCNSTEIQNSNVLQFRDRLRGCTTIAGSLRIVLCDLMKEDDFEHLTFPELKEIRGFLLLYRVSGLTSLDKLFPNLTIIRGNILFRDYSLIVTNLPDLKTVRTFCVKQLK